MFSTSSPLKQPQIAKPIKTKNDTIKVCIRIRPLLQHEDAEFWTVDENTHSISTIK